MPQSRKTDPKTFRDAYILGLAGFVSVLDRAEADGRLNEKQEFSEFLKFVFSNYNISAVDLANDEKISKAAISKWANGNAMPPAPTRKTVITWVKNRLEHQLADYRSEKIEEAA